MGMEQLFLASRGMDAREVQRPWRVVCTGVVRKTRSNKAGPISVNSLLEGPRQFGDFDWYGNAPIYWGAL